MHTEWGSLDINLASYANATAESTTNTNDLATAEALYISLGVWLGMLLLAVVFMKALHSCKRPTHPAAAAAAASCCGSSSSSSSSSSSALPPPSKRIHRRNRLVLCCNRPLGQLCTCCRIAHYESSRWARPLRSLTLDAVSTVSGWSVASALFYASVAALFAAVSVTAPMTTARSSGWLCVGVFSLLMFPVPRKTVLLSLFYGLPFEAAIGHHRVLGRAFVLVQLVHLLLVCVRARARAE
jgi:hypothetical protein